MLRIILRIILLSIFLASLSAGCASPTVAPPPTPALLRVVVTDLTEPLLLDLAAAYAGVNPAVALAPSLAPPAAVEGLLQSGQADLALTTAPNPTLFATPLGYVPFRLVVHPSSSLESISLAQAQSIFSGDITDWAQLGGRAGLVQPVARAAGTAAALSFVQAGLGPLTVTVNALTAPTWDAMRELVAQNPNAIGYLIASLIDNTVKPLSLTGPGGAPLTLRLLAAAESAHDPTGPARAFLAWVQTPAGQAIVARRHDPLEP